MRFKKLTAILLIVAVMLPLVMVPAGAEEISEKSDTNTNVLSDLQPSAAATNTFGSLIADTINSGTENI